MGTISWIKKDFVQVINAAMHGRVMKSETGGSLWYSVQLWCYGFTGFTISQGADTFLGREVNKYGVPDAAIINFIIMEEAVGGQEADLGISITDWKDAPKPPGVRLSAHITSFPFHIKSRVESGSRNFTPNITVSDMVQGTTNPKLITSKDRAHYLEGMKFNLEDTTGSLAKMTRKYGVWMYHPHAAINTKQVEYQKSMSGMELPS